MRANLIRFELDLRSFTFYNYMNTQAGMMLVNININIHYLGTFWIHFQARLAQSFCVGCARTVRIHMHV